MQKVTLSLVTFCKIYFIKCNEIGMAAHGTDPTNIAPR